MYCLDILDYYFFYFAVKIRSLSKDKKGKRKHLNDTKTSDLKKKLNIYFKSRIKIPRLKHRKKQTIETLINKDAQLFAKYLRNERKI